MTGTRPVERRARAAAWCGPVGGVHDVPGLVVRAAGTAAAAAAAGCGGVLALRRLGGAIEPAGPALLIGAAAAGIPFVLAADAGRQAGGSPVGPVVARFGLLLAVVALALPPRVTAPAGWIGIAAALVVTAVAVGWRPRRADRGRGQSAGAAPPRPSAASRRQRGSRREPRPGLLRQRLERRELPAGTERIVGRVVVAVPPGAKAGYGHLGFCPAFATLPMVEVTSAYDGVEATVVAAEVLPWGVRVECRLAEPADEPLEIPVDLVVLAPAMSS